jgi:transposase
MRIAAPVSLTADQQTQLQAWARGRRVAARLVERSRIVLLAAEGKQDVEIAALLSIPRQKTARWRKRFLEGGLAGLEKDAPRAGRPRSITARKARQVVAKTTQTLPANATHWSTRAMAQAAGISEASVRRIWKAHGLKPHRVATFKLSNDPQFVEKLEDIVGLYLNPPEHAMVLSLDEKSQIQALDRTQPGLPLKKGRLQTMTHDYKRHGTTTLFAALNILNGKVIGTCMDKHRHQEWLRFLCLIDRQTPANQPVHLIVDNYATHKHPKVKSWLKRHKRFHIHFIPTSSSWLNVIERWFRDITHNRIRNGVFKSVEQLEQAIRNYIEHHNANPKTFVWTQKAEDILEKVARARKALNKIPSE